MYSPNIKYSEEFYKMTDHKLESISGSVINK